MIRNQMIKAVHLDRSPLTACLVLTRCDRAGVIAVVFRLAGGAQRHRAAAVSAEADAGQQGRPADRSAGRHHGAAFLQELLNGVEGLALDERRHCDGDDLRVGLDLPTLAPPVEFVLADISPARQDAVHRTDAPASAGSRVELALVEIFGDRLHAHPAGVAVALQRQFEHQPDRIGVERVDLQHLLDLGAALFRLDDAVADRRQRPVPEALTGVFLQCPERVLGVLLRPISTRP